MTSPDEYPPCSERPELFDSTHLWDHREARQECLFRCHRPGQCFREAMRLWKDKNEPNPIGTHGGALFGAKVRGGVLVSS